MSFIGRTNHQTGLGIPWRLTWLHISWPFFLSKLFRVFLSSDFVFRGCCCWSCRLGIVWVATKQHYNERFYEELEEETKEFFCFSA